MKSLNRKEHKDFTQRPQSFLGELSEDLAYFAVKNIN